MFSGDYEFAKTTQRMVMVVHQTKAIRRSPCPYVYLSKELYVHLTGSIPQEGEPGTVLSITIDLKED